MEMVSEDEEMIHHFSHEHPLCFIPEVVEWSGRHCYGCNRLLSPGEAAYGCEDDGCYLHEGCAEMPRRIRHAAHPSHLLTQSAEYIFSLGFGTSCAVCEGPKSGLIYECSEGCAMIWIHLRCAAGGSDADDEPAAETKRHPSHPRHELRLQRRKKRSCSFRCDACGTIEKGNLYNCSICNYWIHESCANLPETKDFPLHHPHHSLSLSFYLPYEYSRYEYTCAICDGALGLRRWVYHCRLCRYVVHLKCAATTQIRNENIAADDDESILKLPMNDMYEEIIKPFVRKQGKSSFFIPSNKDKNIIKHKFHNHQHPLNFTTFGLTSSHDDDDDDDDIPRLASLTCDSCTLPIHQNSSGTTSNNCCSYEYDDSGYMFCGECDYFLHLACFNLPPELSSHPHHAIQDHKLKLLQKSNEHENWSVCDVCYKLTNGLVYACTECIRFKLDIKCASLPDTMKHAGHPRPHHFLKLVNAKSRTPSFCGACFSSIYIGHMYYSCNRCRFSLCLECVFLPASNKHRLDKHRMPLTYNASVNHPSDFYCGSCEEKMNPRLWMYHCPDCEESFHPKCFPAASGEYRNINFGSHQRYYVNLTTNYHHPHHPLKFQIITKKKYCDLCRQDVYEEPGFQCADCNFVSCTEELLSITPSSTNTQ